MSQDWEPAWQRPDDEVRPGGNALALDTEFADLVAYCGAVSGRESDAASTAHAVLDSVQPLLTDPDQLRAWLFALARRELLAGGEPPAREVFDLVHRHGILPEDLPVVLGIPPIEADELLANAEADYGDEPGWDNRSSWEDRTDLIERQQDLPVGASPGQLLDAQLDYLVGYCRSLTGREDDALDAAHAVLDSSRSLLTDPDRRRAWLFALARQEMLADAPPVPEEILDLVHRHGIRAEDLPTVLGISAAEAGELLAAAEDQYASSAFGSGRHQAGADHSAGWDGTYSDDGAYVDDGAYSGEEAYSDDGGDWDDLFGPKSRLQDLYGRFRQPPEPAGRHAARTSGGGRLVQALGPGRVRVAAASAIVVAVIGISAAYLAAANSPPPSQASQQTQHRPAASPAATPSPASSDTPTQSPAPSQSVTVVVPPPAPAPTSPRPSPKPSPKPTSSSPSPSPSSSPSPSGSPSATPTSTGP
jgi:hypothetical protein